MSDAQFLTGNQAVARAVWEAGVSVATSYPGSPATQLMEALAGHAGLYTEWSASEKVALEVAIGASLAGARAFCAMKHVGVNIAADPLMTFAYSRVNGGFVLAVGDDPGMHSSQNEQDSRTWGPFGFLPVLEPGDADSARRLALAAFELSERLETPVMLRLFDKTCHMAGRVEVGERRSPTRRGYTPSQADHFMAPPYSIQRREKLEERMRGLQAWAEAFEENRELDGQGRLGLVASGHLALYARELAPGLPLFLLASVFPLPLERLRAFAARFERLLVLEELGPFLEDRLKLAGIACEGKRWFSDRGELTPELIHRGLTQAGVALPPLPEAAVVPTPVPRSPMLCPGCPHRPVIRILQDLKVTCHGDIGCYLMGSYEPFNAFKTSISMAASLGVAMGMGRAQQADPAARPSVSVLGDSTFVHSGLPSLANAAYNGHTLKVVLLDNQSTSMTGCQENPSTGKDIHGAKHRAFDYLGFCRVVGLEDVTEVDQFDFKAARAVLKEKLEAPGKSAVVIAKRPCALKYKVREPYFYVDPDVCIGCRTCIKVSCPPIAMSRYAHKPEGKLNSFIDETMCVGCSVCSQVCPVGAIRRSTPGQIPPVPRPEGHERKG
jgi:indolepyruvate ferredoxin oxidoreductase, alpha subunit